MVTKAARGYITGAVLLAIIFWGSSGCAQQEQLTALVNMPGKLEEASLIAYRASLDSCNLQEASTQTEACRAYVKKSFEPLIALFEQAHQLFCEVLPGHEACKP